ncbi:MAG: hypothetical protein AAF561_12360, partial [Planctomycetota bacterium]
RVSSRMTGFGKAMLVALIALSVVASVRLYPPALLLWTLPALLMVRYKISAIRLSRRVMNLVDLSAERVKLLGVWPESKSTEVEEPVAKPTESFDEISVDAPARESKPILATV